MITGATKNKKNKVDDVWQRMWEGGITNPQEVITQLTYLMFIRSLDDREFENESTEELTGVKQERIFPLNEEGRRMRWSVFKDMNADDMLVEIRDHVFPFVKTLNDGSPFARTMRDATFGINNPRTLQKAVSGIDSLMNDFENHIADLGDLYEYMLNKLSTAGQNGQFRTPKHIRDMMVEMVAPQPGERCAIPQWVPRAFLLALPNT